MRHYLLAVLSVFIFESCINLKPAQKAAKETHNATVQHRRAKHWSRIRPYGFKAGKNEIRAYNLNTNNDK